MSFLTVTLNASIDTAYALEEFSRGEVNRVRRKWIVPGGKGNNVARVLATLGHHVVATGFVAGQAGQYIENALRVEGVETGFVRVAGESRTSLAVIEQRSGTVSELLEPGVPVSPGDGQALLDRIGERLPGVATAVISGSLPPGLPTDFYALLIDAMRSFPVRVAFDSSGDAFRRGLAAHPDLVKPNAAEMTDLIGASQDVSGIIAFAQRELIGPVLAPTAMVLLSLGADGAALISHDAVLVASAPATRAVSTVGSGDALLAGFLGAQANGADDGAALCAAVAAGTAATLHPTPGVVDPRDVARLLPLVRLTA